MKWSAETDLPFSTRETVALLIPIPLANSARLSSEAVLTARRSRPNSRQLIPEVVLLLGIRTGRSRTYAAERDEPGTGPHAFDRHAWRCGAARALCRPRCWRRSRYRHHPPSDGRPRSPYPPLRRGRAPRDGVSHSRCRTAIAPPRSRRRQRSKAAVSNDPPQLGLGFGDRATVPAPNARSARCTFCRLTAS